MNRSELQPHLVGALLELRPLIPADWEELFAAASDPLIWEQHPASDRYNEEVFRKFFEDALASKGALVAIDRKSGRIIGSSRYANNELGELEVGWTFLTRECWEKGYNREMKRLMLNHAFRFVESVVFVIGPENWRSRKAVEKIGGELTELTCARMMCGEKVEHVVYRIGRAVATDRKHEG
ncbi:MAG: N-acetyltransferase [Verrucomicrobiaceae bacterium]|nr:MAG: N-acetyltransferase [Verrucomicrobiaceae bacterium]